MNIQTTLQLLNALISEYEISRQTGISQPNINRLKTGVHKHTSYESGLKIMALAKHHGIDTHDDSAPNAKNP